MNFDLYQDSAIATDQAPRSTAHGEEHSEAERGEIVPLLGLVGEVGSLLAEYKKRLRDGEAYRNYKDEVAEELGDILWYVANVASKFDLRLSDIAAANLAKVKDRWAESGGAPSRLDVGQPHESQLPEHFAIEFKELPFENRIRVVLIDLEDPQRGLIGDPLSDNAYREDGYRFHDVMHLTFAALLGWSPVFRSLLRAAKKLQRRTPEPTHDAEDAGRAQVIDEAIVLTAYGYAANHELLRNVTSVDWVLLRQIKHLTADIEVRNRSTKRWNDAIIRGFELWRELNEHRGGVIRGDLGAGTIEFIPPERQPIVQLGAGLGREAALSEPQRDLSSISAGTVEGAEPDLA